MTGRYITALPVYNEATHLDEVLDEVLRYSDDVLVVDDGSSDGTSELLRRRADVNIVSHPQNRGYGAALKTAFKYANEKQYDIILTIDCDGQHAPRRIPMFVQEIGRTESDIVSGSRYLKTFAEDSAPPEQRRRINQQITRELNQRLGLTLTDTFCGFKAYRVSALQQMKLTEDGYAMPLELWVQAVCWKFKIVELPVPLIYLDEERSFGGALDDGAKRLAYYHDVIERAINALPAPCHKTLVGDHAG